MILPRGADKRRRPAQRGQSYVPALPIGVRQLAAAGREGSSASPGASARRCAAVGNNAKYRRRGSERGGAGMLADLEALTPPLIMAVAFLIGLALFLRHQMRPRDRSADDGEEADIAGRASNDDPGDVNHGPSSDQHKV